MRSTQTMRKIDERNADADVALSDVGPAAR
jgi:hypothetical protein